MKLTIPLFQVFLFSFLILLSILVFGGQPLPGTPAESMSFGEWATKHWTGLALVVSESLAVITPRYSGILKAFLGLFGRVRAVVKHRSK